MNPRIDFFAFCFFEINIMNFFHFEITDYQNPDIPKQIYFIQNSGINNCFN